MVYVFRRNPFNSQSSVTLDTMIQQAETSLKINFVTVRIQWCLVDRIKEYCDVALRSVVH